MGIREQLSKFLLWYKFQSILNMGHMKTWLIFGFEPWFGMRPASMTNIKGTKFIPLFGGLWIRSSIHGH
jgi:hypothetical protein